MLLRSATGENWQLIMRDSDDLHPPLCSNNPPDDGRSTCGTPVSVAYFTTFILLCMFLVINLFVAVIMDNFEYLTEDDALLGEHHLPIFVQVGFC